MTWRGRRRVGKADRRRADRGMGAVLSRALRQHGRESAAGVAPPRPPPARAWRGGRPGGRRRDPAADRRARRALSRDRAGERRRLCCGPCPARGDARPLAAPHRRRSRREGSRRRRRRSGNRIIARRGNRPGPRRRRRLRPPPPPRPLPQRRRTRASRRNSTGPNLPPSPAPGSPAVPPKPSSPAPTRRQPRRCSPVTIGEHGSDSSAVSMCVSVNGRGPRAEHAHDREDRKTEGLLDPDRPHQCRGPGHRSPLARNSRNQDETVDGR